MAKVRNGHGPGLVSLLGTKRRGFRSLDKRNEIRRNFQRRSGSPADCPLPLRTA